MIIYTEINRNQIYIISDLWNKNKEYHIEIEKYFKIQYEKITFEERMEEILNDANREIKITVAKSENIVIGYCISGIKKNEGEIISIHVNSKNRKIGIGNKFLKEHIDWMKKKKCKKIGVFVASINTKTIEFYKNFGFKENLVYMEIGNEE